LGWLKQIGHWIQTVLVPLGGWGLAPAAFLDSSFISLAGGVDLWLVTLSIANPSNTPIYVLAAAIGSVSGATVLNLTMRAGGRALAGKRASSETMQRVKAQLEKYGAWAVMTAALLPPPAPFKLFVVTSGFLGQPLGRFIVGLTVGRLVRYSLVGYLASRYGREVWNWILRVGPWMFGLVVLAVVLAVLQRKLAARRDNAPA
jgi:membrane protein YqaA with SNARE-associated domain